MSTHLGSIALIGLFAVGSPVGFAGGVPSSRGTPQEEVGHQHHAPHGGSLVGMGDRHLELVFDERNGALTLYALDRDVRARPLPARRLVGRVRSEEIAFGELELQLEPLPLGDDSEGSAARFFGQHPELAGLSVFALELSIDVGGRRHAVEFDVTPRSFAAAFVCPMGCEGDRTYRAAGNCPVCGMSLEPPREAHGDHDPRHGGFLFMAPDGWHHLEGVLASPREFRVYLYNNFTQPLTSAASLHGIDGHVVVFAEGRREESRGIEVPMGPSTEGGFLSAPLPEGLSLPVEIEVRLRFAGRAEPDAFDFTFDAVATTE